MMIYRFDKIMIDTGYVRFVSCGENTTNSYPTDFRTFLNSLRATKLQDNLKYDIVKTTALYESAGKFEELLQFFAKQIYEGISPNKEKITKFYKKAYEIYEQAKKDKEILLTDPSELVK